MIERERWTGRTEKRRREVLVDKKWKEKSRIIMEEYLGRPLRQDEEVHHINNIPSDDRLENLKLMTPSEHIRHHAIESNYASNLVGKWGNRQPKPLEKNPNWKGDNASADAKYRRIWRRRKKPQ